MKSSYTEGPMSVGAHCPTTTKVPDAEGKYGSAMNPAPDEMKFTGRTPGKYKSYKREPVPMTKGGDT